MQRLVFYQVLLRMGDSASSGCFDIRMQCDPGGRFNRTDAMPGSPGHAIRTTHRRRCIFINHPVPLTATWQWSFGDSTFSTDQNPTHTYATNAIYHVCLTMTVANPNAPVPNVMTYLLAHRHLLHARAGSPYDNWLSVSFEGPSARNPPATYNWNFGDGTSGSGKNNTHQFTARILSCKPDTVIQDSSQCTFTSTQQIQVGDSNNIHQVYGQVFAGISPCLMAWL